MCVLSAVFDHYDDRFRQQWPYQPAFPTTPYVPPAPAEVQELRTLIAEFREAIAAAKRVDELTQQPDCEDPDKAALETRVAALEKRLDAFARAAQEGA